jgi:hypothetical protein
MSDRLAALREGRLAGARRLDLVGCGLTEFPREAFALADSLEVLDLSRNQLTSLPDDLDRLHRLKVLFCSDNPFAELPAVLGRCEALEMIGFKANRIETVPAGALPPRLRWLILTDNAIEELPHTIGDCTRLQKLMLAGNRLQGLPKSIARCDRLELLRTSANRFERLPDVLATLPRLAWLAIGGNPMNAEAETAALHATALPHIDWHTLTLLALLGEGASGVIHEAQWTGAGEASTVAVKLFKGAVTSDGWPASEMAACIAAGPHPDLIPVLGRVEGHPDGAQGLVLARIPAGWRNLASPPSLDTCTRDIYPEGWRTPVAAAQSMAAGIASAVRQLHARGIVHGDLYAHNILIDGDGGALLGDFGAASFCPAADTPALQRIEARAFGCLLEELVAHCESPTRDPDRAAVQRMSDLTQRCLQPNAALRPSFDEIAQALA